MSNEKTSKEPHGNIRGNEAKLSRQEQDILDEAFDKTYPTENRKYGEVALIDFAKWQLLQGTKYMFLSRELMVKDYLKSINDP